VRRGLGRGRLLIGAGGIIALVGAPLAWYTIGGEVLPAVTGHGLDGAGVLVFLAAVGLLGVLVLPYASRSGRSGLDRPVVYLALVALGSVGLVLEVLQGPEGASLAARLPDRAPGLWLSAAGLLLAGWGTAELLTRRPHGE
jgi:hypothetical protein